MADKNSPGKRPLGHSPFSNVKLEGPKRHHDDHGDKASVPAKGDKRAIPGEHWEMRYNQYDPSENMILTQGADFVARPPSERKTTHLKVNKEDH